MIRRGANVPFCVLNFFFLSYSAGKVSRPLKFLSVVPVHTTPLDFDYTMFCIVFKRVHVVSSLIM